MESIDIQDCRFLLTLAETGGFERAAKRLNTVQSNVSSRIKRLENRLGHRLFDRSRAGVAATEKGRDLIAYARRIVALSEEAAAAVSGAAEPEHAALRLGSMETTAAVRLPPVLARYHRAHPRVALTLTTGPTADLAQRLQNDEIDAAFVAGLPGMPGLRHVTAFVEELALVVPREARNEPLARLLVERTLIVFRRGCSYRARLETLLATHGVAPYRIAELGTLDGILGCVAAGMGISLLPMETVRQAKLRRNLATLALPRALGRAETNLIWRGLMDGRPSLRALLATLEAAAPTAS